MFDPPLYFFLFFLFLTPSKKIIDRQQIFFECKKNHLKKIFIGASIRIGREIHCLPYAEFKKKLNGNLT